MRRELTVNWHDLQPGRALSRDTVHIWRASLDISKSLINYIEATLSADELAHIAGVRSSPARLRNIAAYGLRRMILAHYMNIDPGELRFSYNAYGKPALASQMTELCFNVSHSADQFILALALDSAIGVDIERIDARFPWQEIVSHWFTPNENTVLQSLPSEFQRNAFYTLWTRKEAYMKACGQGFSLKMNQIDVSFGSDVWGNAINAFKALDGDTTWELHDLEFSSDYAATVAIQNNGWSLYFGQWKDH